MVQRWCVHRWHAAQVWGLACIGTETVFCGAQCNLAGTLDPFQDGAWGSNGEIGGPGGVGSTGEVGKNNWNGLLQRRHSNMLQVNKKNQETLAGLQCFSAGITPPGGTCRARFEI